LFQHPGCVKVWDYQQAKVLSNDPRQTLAS